MPYRVAVLPGDGIGPEVTAEAVKVLKATGVDFTFEEALIGGAAYDDGGHPLPAKTLDLCRQSDAVLLGAVGGPKWDQVQPITLRPEVGALLPLRSELNLYANVRPVKTLKPLLQASPLKGTAGLVDIVVMRELTGGIYFGQPRERRENGEVAIDTCIYSKKEVRRIAERAFFIARQRSRNIVSVDKANVLETSRLWREVVTEMAAENTDVSVSHMLVDNCAMQLVRNPTQFDVILTENMFGDILTDEASMIAGSLGLLPSASLGDTSVGLYEPIHGSAPDIAGRGIANPFGTILSAAMLLEHSLSLFDEAAAVTAAVEGAVSAGVRTADIVGQGHRPVGSREAGAAVVDRLLSSP